MKFSKKSIKSIFLAAFINEALYNEDLNVVKSYKENGNQIEKGYFGVYIALSGDRLAAFYVPKKHYKLFICTEVKDFNFAKVTDKNRGVNAYNMIHSYVNKKRKEEACYL